MFFTLVERVKSTEQTMWNTIESVIACAVDFEQNTDSGGNHTVSPDMKTPIPNTCVQSVVQIPVESEPLHEMNIISSKPKVSESTLPPESCCSNKSLPAVNAPGSGILHGNFAISDSPETNVIPIVDVESLDNNSSSILTTNSVKLKTKKNLKRNFHSPKNISLDALVVQDEDNCEEHVKEVEELKVKIFTNEGYPLKTYSAGRLGE